MVVLFPPAFMMGGTLPAMGQHLVREPASLGPTGSLLYAINTLGGMSGAFAAAFILPLAMDFTRVYLLAVGLDLAVGVIAAGLALTLSGMDQRGAAAASTGSPGPAGAAASVASTDGARTAAPGRDQPRMARWLVTLLAFGSGAAALAVEVLWTRMFSQVLHNSVYTYAVVLILFLGALALGSLLASALARTWLPPVPVVAALLAAAGLAVGISPWTFDWLTGGLGYVGGGDEGFARYITLVFAQAAVIILPAGTLLGAVLPYLLRVLQDALLAHGRALAERDDLPAAAVQAAALRFYVGNAAANALLFADAPLNRDDRPVIEYRVPRAHGGDGSARGFVGMDLARFYEQLMEAVPPSRDPYLAGLDGDQRGFVTAGLSYYRYAVLRHEGHHDAAGVFLDDFLQRTPFEIPPRAQTDDEAPSGWETGR